MTSDPPKTRRFRYVAALVMLAALWLTMLLLGGGPLDRGIYEALYAGGKPALLVVARIFTFFGEPTVLIGAGLITAIWLWRAGHRHLPWVLIAIVLIGRGLSEV